ncbi:hypothetical protein [Pseudomonas helleri]|uniref:Uncharacterized protein n=1 Tax=Pseudomonas helleri TaxID=1608996 RepID=A0A6I1WR41_9PSED|nr:hypothetical protein [Pseudomonas helleri]MQU45594.1 hypothetical protein [Pseudomonas helleri]
MGYCKFCDICFIAFCFFVFILYVNPQAFSKPAHEQAIAEYNRIERVKEQQRQENINFSNCVSKTYFKSARTSDNHLMTEAHRFSFQNGECNEVVEVYYR